MSDNKPTLEDEQIQTTFEDERLQLDAVVIFFVAAMFATYLLYWGFTTA